jgi:hypothetical protein
MTRRKRSPDPGAPVIRVNLSWTVWLLIVQPREGMHRFARYPLLWMAVGTVVLAGMTQGSLAAINFGSFFQLAPVFGVRVDTRPNNLILLGTALAVLVWLVLGVLAKGFTWLLEHPTPWQPTLTTVGMAFLPWAAQGFVLPLALAGRPQGFIAITLVTTPVVAAWSAFLLVVALQTVMDTSRRMGWAGFMLVVYTCGCLVQWILLALGLSLAGNALRRIF